LNTATETGRWKLRLANDSTTGITTVLPEHRKPPQTTRKQMQINAETRGLFTDVQGWLGFNGRLQH